MRRLRDGREDSHFLVDSSQSNSRGLMRAGILSLLLHMGLAILLIFSLNPSIPKERMSIYRVTLRPFSPPGGIQSVSPGGGPGITSTPLATEQMKLEESPKGSKVEIPEKGEAPQFNKKDKFYERWRRGEIEATVRSSSQKGEKAKKERDSGTSLQEALEDIQKRAALDKIQKKVEKRGTEGGSAGGQTAQGQPPFDSSKSQGGSSSRGGSGSGSGPGIGTGTGGYPIGGVPWGSPQGSSSWNSRTDEYYDKIWAKIKKEWTLPENLQKGKADLETIIVLVIGREGKIQKSWFEKRSGNSLYDQMAMRAIKKAEPLPPIPDAFTDNTFEIGIRFYPD